MRFTGERVIVRGVIPNTAHDTHLYVCRKTA